METRSVEQTKIYFLVMNPVTDRAESGNIVLVSTSRDSIINFYNNERVETYSDDRFRKSFRQGGPFEWYNLLYDFNNVSHFGHGIKEEWVLSSELSQIQGRYLFIN